MTGKKMEVTGRNSAGISKDTRTTGVSVPGDAKDGGKDSPRRKDTSCARDISSKAVFRNPVLCAQFLRDNFDIPELKRVRPEDIEDISERFLPYLGTQFDADSVSRVRILDIGRKTGVEGEDGKEGKKGKEENKPPFFVSLIDHKSLVEYDAPMQLLRYMVAIWYEYRREMELKKVGSTRQKGFRYPVIIPIIYYEGREEWTADRHLSGRIGQPMDCSEWIPDFKYELVRLHDYSNEELFGRGDEMSLIMMFNKVQDASGLEGFLHIPPEEMNRIVRDSPDHVMDVIVSVMESLCFKIDASEEERRECVRKVRRRDMGYLFENAEHMSLKEERQKTEEERQRAEEERQRAEAAEEKLKIAEEQLKMVEEQLRAAEAKIRQLESDSK